MSLSQKLSKIYVYYLQKWNTWPKDYVLVHYHQHQDLGLSIRSVPLSNRLILSTQLRASKWTSFLCVSDNDYAALGPHSAWHIFYAGLETSNVIYEFYLLSTFIPVAPTWSIGHLWNASFHLKFLNLRQSVGLLGRGISPSQGRYLHRTTQKHKINAHNTDIHALSGIRTHDPSVRAGEHVSYLRPAGHCDRLLI
jgi:hypothetical protein